MIIQTETAVYVIDTLAKMLTRYRREEAPDDWPAPSQLRMDGEAIPYKEIGTLRVGQPAQFLLQIRKDGVGTIRTTTPIRSIDGA